MLHYDQRINAGRFDETIVGWEKPKVGESMKVSDLKFNSDELRDGGDFLYSCHIDEGMITVLDRLTGYIGGVRDIETGFRDNSGKFWLSSGGFDIRYYSDLDIDNAIALIKKRANTCVGA